MPKELSENQFKETVNLVKSTVESYGMCRVGWALRERAGVEFENSQPNICKVAYTIAKNDEYIAEHKSYKENDILIRKINKHWTIRYPVLYMVLQATISIVVSLITTILVNHYL